MGLWRRLAQRRKTYLTPINVDAGLNHDSKQQRHDVRQNRRALLERAPVQLAAFCARTMEKLNPHNVESVEQLKQNGQ